MNGIGVYTITNLVNGKIYVGSALISFRVRWNVHKSKLRNNKHDNQHLQFAWNKYGESNFKFEILEECLSEYCTSTEQYWINMLNVCNRKFGYNKASNTTVFRLGVRNSPEAIEKIRAARKLQKNCGQIEVYKYDLNDNFICSYSSLGEASRKNGDLGTSNICKCINGKYLHCGGFKWKYKDEMKKRKLKKKSE